MDVSIIYIKYHATNRIHFINTIDSLKPSIITTYNSPFVKPSIHHH